VMLGRRTAFLTLPIDDERVCCYGDVVERSRPDGTQHSSPERLKHVFAEFADPIPASRVRSAPAQTSTSHGSRR
jgi:hypothetical protein